MIGFVAGWALLFSYLGVAWSGNDGESLLGSGLVLGLVGLGISCIMGVFLFPRTFGMALTPASFATPIAFIIGWVRQGFQHGLTMLALGVGCWLVTFIIGSLRPEAT